MHRHRGRWVAAALALVPALLLGAAPARAAGDFPSGSTGYHTFDEMVADITAVAAAHPDIVRVFSIGKSHEGRDIWAAKVSDNVATDENEPEVLFDGLHHADEHMTLEMTIAILHWLADGYGTDPRITHLVNIREVWIVFAVNPDGAAYDIRNGVFHHWRKNRQPTPGSAYVGTDLNRNYDYRWGGGGNTSTNPQAITYRGPSAFSAPETRAMRDFVASRVVDGRQQITVAITFHEYGRLVMWPYGYTTTDVPADMTIDDRNALAKIGRTMAASNGYRAQQASDLYLTSGTSRDFLYGRYRIFAYTFELSAVDYPKDTAIGAETGRNREAVLWLAEQASCPLGVLGGTVRIQRCGAYDDDLEIGRGWARDPDGTDTAPASARFTIGDPAGTTLSGVTLQPTTAASGRYALVTGAPAGSSANSYDLDGRTSVRSAPVALWAGTGQRLTFRYVFAHGSTGSGSDKLRAVIEAADGSRTVVFERVGRAALVRGSWQTASVPLDAWAGTTVRIRFEAQDGGPATTLEVLVDDVRVTRPTG